MRLSKNDPIAQELVEVVHAGEVERLRELLGQHPGLASVRIVDDKGGSGTALDAATDRPGFFARGPEVVGVLIEAGADPNAPVEGSWHAETPLHWAASSDDVEVARALIDGGADTEAAGASIAGGSPLGDAVATSAGRWRSRILGLMQRIFGLPAHNDRSSARIQP